MEFKFTKNIYLFSCYNYSENLLHLLISITFIIGIFNRYSNEVTKWLEFIFSWIYPCVNWRYVTEIYNGIRFLLYYKVIYFYFTESSCQIQNFGIPRTEEGKMQSSLTAERIPHFNLHCWQIRYKFCRTLNNKYN